ncbi:helix-turn-helix domain-containing protein [Lactococcus garvieae]|uniref:helix-turn-helix domain-containing protein n=1 Tax=Lactococcus garvieae TaxID=1363 RepID=UPI0018D89492|nr:helix-turn-helix domain-containing protein [Lactococcus garvieae]QPS70659.1 helix-turn-helix domain-containing protein [Lactococcus garvieae]
MVDRKAKNDLEYPLFLYKKEAAEMMGVSIPWFDGNIAHCPGLPKVKIGTEIRYPRDSFINWIGQNWERFK